MEEFCDKLLLDPDIDEEKKFEILQIFISIGREPGSAFWMSKSFYSYVCLTACPFAKLTLM
jgi:hypothetical protein